MYNLTEHSVFILVLQIALLLGIARGLGMLFRRLGQPALIGEIITGVILGPSIFGRFVPEAHAFIFPANEMQFTMLGTVAWIGILFLLLSAGLEVDVSAAWRQRAGAVKIAAAGILVPLGVAFVPAFFLPDQYLVNPSQRLLFSLFVATVMMISSLPVALKAMHDMDVLKSDLGLLAVSALTINDIVGWTIFTIVFGFATGATHFGHVATVIAGTLVFAGVCLLPGRRAMSFAIARIQKSRGSDPGTVLTFICCVGLAAGAITQWIGINALFGLFLAGIMAGGATALSERTRTVISQMVYSIFVPVFFASVALQIDIFREFDLLLVMIFTLIGVSGRFLGAWIGARMTPLSHWDRVSIAIIHSPGGSMEIVMGLAALQIGLIKQNVFVAIVISAIISAVMVGPWLTWSLRRRTAINLIDLFVRRAMRLHLAGPTRWEAIRELCEAAGEHGNLPEAGALLEAVTAREHTAGTAIGYGIAIPHARIPQLRKSAVIFGRSKTGVEWDSPDGIPARFVFLILTPVEEGGMQVQILAALAHALANESLRTELLEARDERTVWNVLHGAFSQAGIERVKPHDSGEAPGIGGVASSNENG